MSVETSLVQINNTIVPVIHRKYQHELNVIPLVPLDVVRHTFGPLTHVNTLLCTENEARALNKCCQQANVKLSFHVNSQLIHLDCLLETSTDKVVFSLPSNQVRLDRLQEDILDLRTEKKKKQKEEASKIGEEASDKQSTLDGCHQEEHKSIESCQREPTESEHQQIDHCKGQPQPFEMIDIKKEATHTSSTSAKKEACAEKRKPFVIKKTIFGKKISCLLRKEAYFIFLEQLHRCFFSHVNFVKFVFIVSRLGSSIVHLSEKERAALPRCFGDIKCGQMIELCKVKCLLVKTKAVLERSKSLTQPTDSDRNKDIDGKDNQHNGSAPVEGNTLNIVLGSALTTPIVISTSGVILNIVSRVDHVTRDCSTRKLSAGAPTSRIAPATELVTTTASGEVGSIGDVHKNDSAEVNFTAEEERGANKKHKSRRRHLDQENSETVDKDSTSRARKHRRLMDAVEKLAKRNTCNL